MQTDKERLAQLEVRADHTEDEVKSHAEHLAALDKALTSLVTEVRQIRNALYAMAVALAANIPALAHLMGFIKNLF